MIYDKPAENRLFMRASQGDSLAASLTGGLPEAILRGGAISFLASRGRRCQVIDGAEVFEDQSEFFYTCP